MTKLAIRPENTLATTLRVPAAILLPDNATYTNRMAISGSGGREYIIAQGKKNRAWSCGCPGFIFAKKGKKQCKHLRALGLQGNYEAQEVEIQALSSVQMKALTA